MQLRVRLVWRRRPMISGLGDSVTLARASGHFVTVVRLATGRVSREWLSTFTTPSGSRR